jgi:ferredoxin
VKVHVDSELCQGHTLCAMNAPKVFELDEVDGHAWVADENVPGDQEEAVTEAVHSCPERAISIT